ncbi:MAG: hypothetical protein R3C61_29175 [Bacteroidia bacterium]
MIYIQKTTPFFLLFLLAIIACQEDSFDPRPGIICRGIPGDPVDDYIEIQEFPTYQYPVFNPLNPDEFAYARYDLDTIFPWVDEREIHIYNLNTGEDRSIYHGPLWSGMDWGVNGWLLINRADNQVWKIKADGDSLTQLTFSGINEDARWNADATRFVAWRSDNSIYEVRIYDSNGYFLHLVETGFSNGAWAPSAHFLSSIRFDHTKDFFSVASYDSSDNIISQYTFPRKNEYAWEVRHDPRDEEVFYATTSDYRFLRIHFDKGIQKNLSGGCETDKFIHFSVSPVGDQILADRASIHFADTTLKDGTQEKNKVLHLYTTIWLMDENGNKKRQVELP